MKKKLVLRSLTLGFVLMFSLVFNSLAFNTWEGKSSARQEGRGSEERGLVGQPFIVRLNYFLDLAQDRRVVDCVSFEEDIINLFTEIYDVSLLFSELESIQEELTISEQNHIDELYRLLDFDTGTNFSVEYALAVMIFRVGDLENIDFYRDIITAYYIDMYDLITSFIDVLILRRSVDLYLLTELLNWAITGDYSNDQAFLQDQLVGYVGELYSNTHFGQMILDTIINFL